MSGRWPFTAEKIASRLALIGPYVHRRRIPLAPFRMKALPEALVDAPICADPAHWEEIAPNSYWGHADLNFIMKSGFVVPDGWDAAHLALHLPLGVLGDIFNHPEALVYIDQQPVGSADRYHHTLPLDPNVADGASHTLALHGWTGLAGWPPDLESKAKLFMGTPALVERDADLLAFCRLAETVLDCLGELDPDSKTQHVLLEALDTAVMILDTRAPIGQALYASAGSALAVLQAGVAEAGAPLDVTLHGIGHAHMDIAYLWPISQIRLKNARTYSNVLRLMQVDPDFRFSHSQPQLYAMTAKDYPQIFERIRARVAEGRWEVMGGMWVEPDLNIPGPEALVRQLMLGRQYFRDTFGDVETPVLWLPDTFGFPAQTPQLMRLAGLKWFVTNKLNWNQLNQVPSSTHQWEGLDGSRVLAHILTTPRDVQYLPFPTNYKSDLSAAEVGGTWVKSTAQKQIRELPICYGYGDGGGGPTEDLLAKARAFASMPGMPRFKNSTVREFFESIEAQTDDLPVWAGEHYMEGHRGVFTSQGWIKRANRKAEWALHEAEALSAMAGLTPDLRKAWELLCLNQFHDILAGTSIGQVFDDARRDFETIMQIAEDASKMAAQALVLSEMSVANTSPITGPRLVAVEGSSPPGAQATASGGLVYFEALPAYSVAPVSVATMPQTAATAARDGEEYVLENARLKAVLNRSGQLVSVYDRIADREVLKPGALGNELLAFEDRPICWDAWDIDPSYEDRSETIAGQSHCDIVESGPLRASIAVTTHWRNSTIRQIIRLRAFSNRVDFETEVDWHETHTLVKASFPTSISSRTAEFDIQWGRVTRSTSRASAFDAARFEVPAQKWARLADNGYSVAVLNDCKYGYDVTEDTLRVTLIKSSTSPDPNADQGLHRFTYSLFAQDISTRCDLEAESYDLNAPIRVLPPTPNSNLAPMTLVRSSDGGPIIETVKPSECNRGIVLRMFEPMGCHVETALEFEREVLSAEIVGLLEDHQETLETDGRRVPIHLAPFQILTILLVFKAH